MNPDTPRERVSLREECAKAIGEEADRRHGSTMMSWAVSPERVDCLAFTDAVLTVLRKRGALSMDAFYEVRAGEKGKP